MSKRLDTDVVEVMRLCKALNVTVHVRGTDEDPRVEFRSKRNRKPIGEKDLRRMMDYLNG